MITGETGCSFAAQRLQDLVELVRLDEYISRFGAFAGSDDAPTFHEIHEPACLGKAHAQLPLEHRCGAELGGDDKLDGLAQQVEIVADVLVDLLFLRRCSDVVTVSRR